MKVAAAGCSISIAVAMQLAACASMKNPAPEELASSHTTVAAAVQSDVTISVDANGQTYWNEDAVSDEQLADKLAKAAASEPQPHLHVALDPKTPYAKAAAVFGAIQNSGVSMKLGVIGGIQ